MADKCLVPNRKIIEQLRRTYKKGTRIQLERMDDVQAPPVGTKGTVIAVDDLGSIMVKWDNGSSLSLVYGIDSCWILHTVTTVCYGEKRIWDSREDAVKYFLDGALACEGSESERYLNIVRQLKEGLDFATDEIV